MPRRRLAFAGNAGQPRATINAAWHRLLPGPVGSAVMTDRAVTLVLSLASDPRPFGGNTDRLRGPMWQDPDRPATGRACLPGRCQLHERGRKCWYHVNPNALQREIPLG